jgi:twinkle protein
MIVQNVHKLIFKEGISSQKIACPKCTGDRKNKSDKSLSVDAQKRVFHCHHCGWSGRIDGWVADRTTFEKPKRTGWSKLGDRGAAFLKSRGFSLPTIEKNKLIQKQFGGKEMIGYPYFLPNETDPVNIKWRGVGDKSFGQEKNAFRVLYNITLWGNSDTLIFVEGENDVIALNECGLWNVTTLSDGAINENDKSVDGKLTSLHNSYEYVKGFKTFILATDNDTAGNRLRDELIKVLGPQKCKVVSWGENVKDANQALLDHGKEFALQCISSATVVPVSGIMRLGDRRSEMLDNFRKGIELAPTTHMGEFDELFRWKKGDSNLWTGYMNHGKTTFLLQAMLTKSIMSGWKWAVFSPENFPADDFYDDLVEMYVGKHVSDAYRNKMTEAEYIEGCNFIDEHLFFIYPEENHSIDTLHEKFFHMILEFGIDGVTIDPYNQTDKMGEANTESEVTEFMKKVNKFALHHNLVYNVVVHPKALTLPKDGDFKPADFHTISGGAMWGNMTKNMISCHRPNWFTNRIDPKLEVYIQKVKRKRTGGRHGMMEFYFDFMKSRYHIGMPDDPSRKYFCDPARRDSVEYFKVMDAISESPKQETIEPNDAFIHRESSQSIKEQEDDDQLEPYPNPYR